MGRLKDDFWETVEDFKGVSPRTFYQFGVVCFSVVALCTVGSFVVAWGEAGFFSLVSKLAMFVFQVALVGMFIFLLRTQGVKAGAGGELTAGSLDDAFEEAKKG